MRCVASSQNSSTRKKASDVTFADTFGLYSKTLRPVAATTRRPAGGLCLSAADKHGSGSSNSPCSKVGCSKKVLPVRPRLLCSISRSCTPTPPSLGGTARAPPPPGRCAAETSSQTDLSCGQRSPAARGCPRGPQRERLVPRPRLPAWHASRGPAPAAGRATKKRPGGSPRPHLDHPGLSVGAFQVSSSTRAVAGGGAPAAPAKGIRKRLALAPSTLRWSSACCPSPSSSVGERGRRY